MVRLPRPAENIIISMPLVMVVRGNPPHPPSDNRERIRIAQLTASLDSLYAA